MSNELELTDDEEALKSDLFRWLNNRVCRCRLRDSVGRPITTRNCHGCGRTREATIAVSALALEGIASASMREAQRHRDGAARKREERPMKIYLVRLGKVRGEGEYVHPFAFVDSSGEVGFSHWTDRQKRARRFTRRDVAQRYADAFGGRVVRLRERSGR